MCALVAQETAKMLEISSRSARLLFLESKLCTHASILFYNSRFLCAMRYVSQSATSQTHQPSVILRKSISQTAAHIQTLCVRRHDLLSYSLSCHCRILFVVSIMQLSVRELRLCDEWTLPSFTTMFPFATSQSVPNILPIDASMTLGGMAPLNDTETKVETVPVPAIDTADFNEIETAFASLDTEADDVCKSDGSLPLEFRCRYRRGKCLQPRTLKKNGSMHSYCEYHRQLSVRNQRAFDQKKRCQRREDEAEKAEDDKTVSQRQISDSRVEDVEAPNLRAKQRSKRRRRAP